MTDDAWKHLPLTDLSYQILLSLADEARHGYAILKTIAERTDGRIEPASGTLYTAIRRLAGDGLLEGDPDPSDGRRGKSYRLTPLGRRVLAQESRRLAGLVAEARRRDVLPAEGSPGGG